MSTKFGITVTAQLKHADLFKACKKLKAATPNASKLGNGQSLLARELGIEISTLGNWVNLRSCPPVSWEEVVSDQKRFKRWTPERFRAFEIKMLELTGKTLDELFPIELRENADFLAQSKSIEATKEIDIRALGHEQASRLLLPSPADTVAEKLDTEEMKRQMETLLNGLTRRQREIIKLRFGFNDGYSYTFKQIANIFKITEPGVRQTVMNVMERLGSDQNAAAIFKKFINEAEMTGYDKIDHFAQQFEFVSAETRGMVRTYKFKEQKEAVAFRSYLESTHHIIATIDFLKCSVLVTDSEASKLRGQ